MLAVPGAVSALGTVTRYLGAAAGNDQNRWTPPAAHGAAYAAMPGTVEHLVAGGLVDRITVSTRAQHILYDRSVTADVAAGVATDARRAVEVGRSLASMSAREGREWVREFVTAAARISRLPEVAEDLTETMRRLSAVASELIRHTHDPASRAAAREAVAGAEVARDRPRDAGSDQAQWWGIDVDHSPMRTPGEIAARTAKDTEATTIAHDVAKKHNRTRNLDR